MHLYRKIGILLLSVFLLIAAVFAYQNNKENGMVVRAYGPLIVTFPSSPMFNETNWTPGKSVTKTVNFDNTDIFARLVGIRAYNFQDTGTVGLSHGLKITIERNGQVYYGANGSKTLFQFYSEPVVWLDTLAKGEKRDYSFTVTMENNLGNEFQGSSTFFDLVAGYDSPEFLLPTLKPLPTLRPLPTLKPLPTFPAMRFQFRNISLLH